MRLFRRKEDKLIKLLTEYFENNGLEFAKHQMREQADNAYRIRLIERNENRKEKLSYLNHKAEIMDLTKEEKEELEYLKWFVEKRIES